MKLSSWARNSPLLQAAIYLTLVPTTTSTPITPSSPCDNLIKQSLIPDFSWKSPTALSLAQCILSTTPPNSSCVFYTSVTRETAVRYAYEHSQMTIYDVYSSAYFNSSQLPASHYQATGHLRDFFRVTSRAYAIACSGKATLVIPEDVEPCPTSIWIEEEYDAIVKRLSGVELPVIKANWTRSLLGDVGSAATELVEKLPARGGRVIRDATGDDRSGGGSTTVARVDPGSQRPLRDDEVTIDKDDEEKLKAKLADAERFGGDNDYWSEQLCVL